MKRLFMGLVFSLSLSVAFAQDSTPAQQDPLLLQQMSLSSAVRSALRESRQSMEASETFFKSMIQSLEQKLGEQSKEILTLKQNWTDTTNSYRNASTALEASNAQLEQQKAMVRTRNTILFWAGIITLINVAGKIVMFILYVKRIPAPRWLDIII